MGMQKGKDLVLLVGDGGQPETFTPLAGVTARTFRLSAPLVELTDAQSPGRWRELSGGAGVRQMSVAGSGTLRNTAADAAVRDAFLAQAVRNWRLVAPGLGSFTGPFLVTGLDYAGTQDGEAEWSLTLTSAGAVAFAG